MKSMKFLGLAALMALSGPAMANNEILDSGVSVNTGVTTNSGGAKANSQLTTNGQVNTGVVPNITTNSNTAATAQTQSSNRGSQDDVYDQFGNPIKKPTTVIDNNLYMNSEADQRLRDGRLINPSANPDNTQVPSHIYSQGSAGISAGKSTGAGTNAGGSAGAGASAGASSGK